MVRFTTKRPGLKLVMSASRKEERGGEVFHIVGKTIQFGMDCVYETDDPAEIAHIRKLPPLYSIYEEKPGEISSRADHVDVEKNKVSYPIWEKKKEK